MNDKKLFLEFKDSEFIQTIYDSLLKSIPFDKEREKNLLSRIMRNSSEHKEGSKSEKIADLIDFAKKEGFEYSEFLEKYCLFVEAGLYITRHVSPESMFGTYELIFNSKIDPNTVKSKYVNFYIPEKGMSQGQKTMQLLENARKTSTDITLTLLDEPTNSLPESKISEVADIIKSTKGQKFIATHNTVLIDLLSKNSTVINFYMNPVAVKYI